MKTALVVIFNHKYNKNIPMLKRMYEKRFSDIFFLVPFYEGDDPRVITVYESSHQFQGYIAQARERLAKLYCSHYVFIGDDLILNPIVNEDNILEMLGVNNSDGYIESITRLKDTDYWYYTRFSDVDRAFQGKAVNFATEIPSIEDADKKAKEHGITDYKIRGKINCKKYGWKHVRMNVNKLFNSVVNPIHIEYPLITGYSDFFVLPKNHFEEFCKLSGIFAAMRLFVEVSIPTALMLILDKDNLKLQKDAKMLTPKLWWHTELVKNFEKKCNYTVDNMEKNWPENYLYLHPVKLSKWK